MIVAASLSNYLVEPQNHGSYITSPGKEWVEAENLKPVVKNSILDFSFLLDAPAGKHGFLKYDKDRLLFADGTPARFWGGNLILSACVLEKKDADTVAEQLATLGYNMVRLHGHDFELNQGKGRLSSVAIGTRAEILDRFDYQMATLKKHGIYICQDLYAFRRFNKEDFPEYPNYALQSVEYKMLIFLKKNIREDFKQFAANLLNHVNPYTGLAMKDDPAYPMISLINEDTLTRNSQRTPLLKKEFNTAFDEYARENKWHVNVENRDSFYNRFLIDIHRSAYREIHDFFRGIGVKAMLSDLNLQQDFTTMISRKELDFVDNHFYWGNMVTIGQGKNYMERLPVAISSASSIPQFTAGLKNLFPSRIFGKPFIVSEYDYLNPGKYNIEGGFVPTAYASLQNWDGLFRFAYGDHWKTMMEKENHLIYFQHANDPMTLMAQRVGALFFLRGDVAPSQEKFIFSISEKHYENTPSTSDYPEWMNMLGLIGQAGTVFHGTAAEKGINIFHVESALPSNVDQALKKLSDEHVIPEALIDLKQGRIRSSTGEIELNARNNSFRVVTPKSEGFLMEANQKMQGSFSSAISKSGFCGIMVAAYDNLPLQDSKRLLIFHLTDAKGKNQQFADSSMTLIESWGDKGSVFRNGTAEITLNTTNRYRIYACALDGKRLFEVPTKQSGESLSFSATIGTAQGVVCVYEAIRE